MLNLITVDEKANQTTVQVSLLAKRRKNVLCCFELTRKVILDFSTVFCSPVPFKSLGIQRATQLNHYNN